MYVSSSGDSSLLIDSSVNVESLERGNGSRGQEEMADKGGVNKVSGGSTVYESGGYDGSCSVL